MEKQLIKFGVAAEDFTDSGLAMSYTYTTRDGGLPPTNPVHADNPYSNQFLAAKVILDIGCGVGRNLKWWMENTDAIYLGLDPNESMLQFFWDWNDEKYKDRVVLAKSFDELTEYAGKIDAVMCTFVYMHIGDRPQPPAMNITDITQEAMKLGHKDTVWFLYEHDGEELWIDRFFAENKVVPKTYIRDYVGMEELTQRGTCHHLIIFSHQDVHQ